MTTHASSFPFDPERRVRSTLKKVFGFDSFKTPLQESAIMAVVKGGKDVFVCMPTGAGKSLCYQLPALLAKGITIVISPLIALIQLFSGCGIVYCRTREACEQLAIELSHRGVNAKAYHAGLKASERTLVQNEWMEEKVAVIVATISFGMGVDKANVRFVAHWNIAKSMAGYYQESGRAGRDGKPSWCRLYYSRNDRDQVSFLVRKEVAKLQEKRGNKASDKAAILAFDALVTFCEELGCRHAAIARYFGDAPPACTKACDHCQNPAAVRRQLDALEHSTSWSKTCIRPSQGGGFDPELYEGGRGGLRGFSRYDEGSGGSGDEGRDEANKREWNLFYQKQMRLRKGSAPKVEEFLPPDEDCPLREASSRKIPRLTVKAREHCLRLLEEALSSNCQAAGATEGADLQAKAVELEHETFRNAKMANLYKASVLKKVAEIHKASKDGQLYSDVGGAAKSCSARAAAPEPNEYDILPASQVYSPKPRRMGAGAHSKDSCPFQTATELMEKTRAREPAPQPGQGGEQKPPSQRWGLQSEDGCEGLPGPRGEAPAGAERGAPSPEKKAKGSSSRGSPMAKAPANKKQQLLAEAARKDSQSIARFFCQRVESLPPPTPAAQAEGASPCCQEGRGTPPATESTCPLRDQGPLEAHPTPPEEAQRSKRPRPEQENTESQAQKRLCPSAKPSVLAEAKGSVSARDQGTLNPRAQGPCRLSAPGLSLKETADVVVKCLTPLYKEGKFASKELFKGLARHLSHLLAQTPSPGSCLKEEAQKLIKQFFRGRARCESEADWLGPARGAD
ncbi:ATP-dependent DNA helicase Q5 isoform X2 [Dasypus novemcinctus]|uniref:ATP-dependent DNA helicase Q5 isoform X2 n=1 Tax=Dasypus novemcinctus TaxID=9361 RepID=UPI00265EEB7D|nr:ATP-dependent DNA helicase Q5 isoform X2 [Dasypus novemcinctus]